MLDLADQPGSYTIEPFSYVYFTPLTTLSQTKPWRALSYWMRRHVGVAGATTSIKYRAGNDSQLAMNSRLSCNKGIIEGTEPPQDTSFIRTKYRLECYILPFYHCRFSLAREVALSIGRFFFLQITGQVQALWNARIIFDWTRGTLEAYQLSEEAYYVAPSLDI